MCAGWPHQGLGTRKVEEEGDRPFLRIQQSNSASCGGALAAKEQDSAGIWSHTELVLSQGGGQNMEVAGALGRWRLSLSFQVEGGGG